MLTYRPGCRHPLKCTKVSTDEASLESPEVGLDTMNQLLFLCSGNYYRSRFAEEVFNYKARALMSDWRADSRGLRLNPNNFGPIAEVVLRRLARLEVDPINAGRPPEALKEADLEDAAFVVAMSQQEHYPLISRMFPNYADQITYWDVEDTGRMLPDLAFRKIESLVDQLIEDVHTE